MNNSLVRRSAVSLAALLTLSCGTGCPEAAAADWPQWRGPGRTGVSLESDWRSDWGSNSPKTLWEAQVGTGFATVAVAGERVYTLGFSGGEETVWCLKAEDGRPLWKHSYSASLIDNLHEGGPAATPTVANGRVYTCSKDGQVHAFDAAKGEVLWRADIRKLARVKVPTWGFSSSLLLHDGRLILDAGPLVALSARDGSLAWKTKKFTCGYSSPVLLRHGGKDFVTVLNNDGLLVASLPGGDVVDLFRWRSSYATSSTTPVVSNDKVFISTGYKTGAALLEFDGEDLTPVYRNKEMSNHMNACVLVDGYLYGFDGNSNTARRRLRLVCLELATGKARWKQSGLGCGSLIAAAGKLILLGDRGELVLAEASPRGYREFGRRQVLDGRCWTSPVLAGGRIYCRNAAGRLVCVDVRRRDG